MLSAGRYLPAPVARTLPGLLDEMVDRYPDHDFIIDGSCELTYREFREEVVRFAGGLSRLGIRRGDKVAILMGNQLEWLVADFAIVALGGVMVSINTWTTARELDYMLNHSEAAALVMSDQFASTDYVAMVAGLFETGRLPKLRHVIRVNADARPLAG